MHKVVLSSIDPEILICGISERVTANLLNAEKHDRKLPLTRLAGIMNYPTRITAAKCKTADPRFNQQSGISPHCHQLETVFQYLMTYTATASMIAETLGIYQKNICRYKRVLEKAGLLWEIERKRCKKTGRMAWYLTTNPEKAHKLPPIQQNLFSGYENAD